MCFNFQTNEAISELIRGLFKDQQMEPRVVHGSDGPAGRVGSGRVGSGRAGSGHDFAGFWRVGSGQHFGFISFLLIISWYLSRYESSNSTFGLIAFHRYLIYNNYFINK